MPIVRIDMWSGRSDEEKAILTENVANTVAKSLEISKEHLTVLLNHTTQNTLQT